MKNDVLFLIYLIPYEVTVAATVYILTLNCNIQAFIQATLSTAVFPQRFSFLTVYLVQWLRGWPHGGDRREVFSNLSLQIAVKCIFLGFFFFFNFRVLLRVVKKSLPERQLQPSLMHVTKELEKWVNRMENLSRVIQKQKRNKRRK